MAFDNKSEKIRSALARGESGARLIGPKDRAPSGGALIEFKVQKVGYKAWVSQPSAWETIKKDLVAGGINKAGIEIKPPAKPKLGVGAGATG